MKKMVLILFLCFGFTASVPAATEDIPQGMLDKAVNGAVNLVTGIVEWPVQTCKGYQNGCSFIENEVCSKTVGTILGFFRGIGHAAGRTSWGALELFGFWTANRENNEGIGIPLDAPYAWEMGEQYSIFDPSLEEGLLPIWDKLVIGLTDNLLAVAELPGQIILAKEEGRGAVDGVVKGVWFWFSRQVYGIGSLWTCLVPNPKENPGYAYKGKWAWSALVGD